MKKALLLLIFLSLTACGTFQNKKDLPIIITEQSTEYVVPEVNIDTYLLAECQDLIKLVKIDPTYADVILLTKDNTILYAECSNKHSALIKVLKISLNLKDTTK